MISMAQSDMGILALSFAAVWAVGFLIGLSVRSAKQFLEKIL